MIRPLTCICLLLAGGTGLTLYQSKHEAQMLDREIARTLKATETARDRIGVLRGEWALLNEPERLAGLSQMHLGLATLVPAQFVSAAELGARLPPAGTPGPVVAAADEAVPAPEPALPSPQPAPAVPVAEPAAPAASRPNVAAKPTQAASGTPNQAASPPAPRPNAKTAEHHDSPAPRSPMQVASALPMPAAPLPAPRPPSGGPVLAPVVNVSASPIAAPPQSRSAHDAPAHAASLSSNAMPARPAPHAPENLSIGESVARTARASSVTAQATPPASGQAPASATSASALGGARPLLPPPVPFGSALAASSPAAR